MSPYRVPCPPPPEPPAPRPKRDLPAWLFVAAVVVELASRCPFAAGFVIGLLIYWVPALVIEIVFR